MWKMFMMVRPRPNGHFFNGTGGIVGKGSGNIVSLN
jgi:hypothetical protein